MLTQICLALSIWVWLLEFWRTQNWAPYFGGVKGPQRLRAHWLALCSGAQVVRDLRVHIAPELCGPGRNYMSPAGAPIAEKTP